jgi:hypothetical protein
MSDISKDLQDQPKFQDEIGSKDQDHHTFELEKPNTLKKNSKLSSWQPNHGTSHYTIRKCCGFWSCRWGKVFLCF